MAMRRLAWGPSFLPSRASIASVAAMATESLVRRAILDGMDPQEAYLKHGKF